MTLYATISCSALFCLEELHHLSFNVFDTVNSLYFVGMKFHFFLKIFS